jgi:hypothetical protein
MVDVKYEPTKWGCSWHVGVPSNRSEAAAFDGDMIALAINDAELAKAADEEAGVKNWPA